MCFRGRDSIARKLKMHGRFVSKNSGRHGAESPFCLPCSAVAAVDWTCNACAASRTRPARSSPSPGSTAAGGLLCSLCRQMPTVHAAPRNDTRAKDGLGNRVSRLVDLYMARHRLRNPSSQRAGAECWHQGWTVLQIPSTPWDFFLLVLPLQNLFGRKILCTHVELYFPSL